MNMALHTVGERLKWAREQAGVSVGQVALIVGVSYSYLSRIEKNATAPSRERAVELAKLYSVGVGWILTGAEQPVPEIRGLDKLKPDDAALVRTLIGRLSGSDEEVS